MKSQHTLVLTISIALLASIFTTAHSQVFSAKFLAADHDREYEYDSSSDSLPDQPRGLQEDSQFYKRYASNSMMPNGQGSHLLSQDRMLESTSYRAKFQNSLANDYDSSSSEFFAGFEQNQANLMKAYDFGTGFKNSGRQQIHGYVDKLIDDAISETDANGYVSLCEARETAVPLAKAYGAGYGSGDDDALQAAIDKLEGKLHLQVDYYIEGISFDLLMGLSGILDQQGGFSQLSETELEILDMGRDRMHEHISAYLAGVHDALTTEVECSQAWGSQPQFDMNKFGDLDLDDLQGLLKNGRGELHKMLVDLLDSLDKEMNQQTPRLYEGFDKFSTMGRTQLFANLYEDFDQVFEDYDSQGLEALCNSRQNLANVPAYNPMMYLKQELDKLNISVHVGIDLYVEGITPDLFDALQQMDPNFNYESLESDFKADLETIGNNYLADLQKALTAECECSKIEGYASPQEVVQGGRKQFEKLIENRINAFIIQLYNQAVYNVGGDDWNTLYFGDEDFDSYFDKLDDENENDYEQLTRRIRTFEGADADAGAADAGAADANDNNTDNNNDGNKHKYDYSYDPDDSDIVPPSVLDAMDDSDGLVDDFLDDFLGDLLGGLFYEDTPQKTQEHVETHYSSWGDALSESITTAIIGFILIFFTLPCLWFNERRAVQTQRIIEDGYKICQDTDAVNVDTDLDGDLVHVCAKTVCHKTLHDEDFGVTVENCAKLKRHIEVYQVQELSKSQTKKDQLGGGKTTTTTYQYDTVWNSTKIDSSKFKDPEQKPANDRVNFFTQSKTISADKVMLGQYELNKNQIERLFSFEDVQLSKSVINQFSKKTRDTISKIGWAHPNQYVEGNYIYIRQSHSQEPQIGDIRLSFQKVPCDWVTVVSEQSGRTFIPYNISRRQFKPKSDSDSAKLLNEQPQQGCCDTASDSIDDCCWKCCCCLKCAETIMRTPGDIDWIYEKKMDKKQTFDSEISSNSTITWLLRTLGIIGLAVGIYWIFAPVIALLSVVKILADIVGFAIGLCAFLIAVALGFIVIAISWVFYRPIIGISLLVISTLIWVFVSCA